MKDNFMVDLETLGTKPYSIILSIGVVAFNTKTGELGSEFYQTIDQDTSRAVGLTSDPATVEWWNKQDPNVKAALYVDTMSLQDTLASFTEWFKLQHRSYKYVWGNSAAFDLGLLAQAYEKCGMSPPWHYTNERCLRTIVSLRPVIRERMPRPSGAHHPIVDCKYQIKYLVKILQSL